MSVDMLVSQTAITAAETATTNILEGRHLSHTYGSGLVLDDVNFGVQPGEVVAVMGRSGSGKSTLLHLLAGLLKPTEGEVWFNGEHLDTLKERQRSAYGYRKWDSYSNSAI